MTFEFLPRFLRVAAAVAILTSGTAFAAVNLPKLNVDKTQTSVSGLSSGGFMAVQMHVAFSGTFKKGVGVVAGGPFYCAEGSITNATGRCMASPAGIPTSRLVTTTNNWATSGIIDPVANMQQSKVYLFSGSLDSTVRPGVMDALRTYYNSFVPTANVVYKKDIAAEHAMITDDFGSTCSTKASPYINDCNFDLAGAMLQQIYGPLNPRNNNALPAGNFVEFNQSQFITAHGMSTTGWAYIPAACTAGEQCRVHVVFHGCQQNYTLVGDKYVRSTGYNRWGDTNKIIMLYPQTSTAATNSCWDWWGYDSVNYAKKSGPQMAAVKAMVDQLSSGTPASTLAAPTGVATSGATTSTMNITWNGVTGASSFNVYRAGNKVNGVPVMVTNYTDGGLVAGTTYSWTVKAVDGNGAESAASAAASGTTTGTPPPTATCYTSSNYAHVTAGRATTSGGYTYAKGSGQNMGLYNTFVTKTLKQTSPGYYIIGTC
jgi:poly(3-hydroxybutyrate) depolymerase